LVAALTLASCQADAPNTAPGASSLAAETTAVTGTTPSPDPVPSEIPVLAFDYTAELGASSFDIEQSYGNLRLLSGVPPTLTELIGYADAVVIIDVISIGEPHLNSADNLWWASPHNNDESFVQPRTGTKIQTEVVGVIKARSGPTSYSAHELALKLSKLGTPHPSLTVPSQLEAGQDLEIWIEGGIATVVVPAEEWNKYLRDWGEAAVAGHHNEDGEEVTSEVTEDFTMEIGNTPTLDVSVGGRYLVFLRPWGYPTRDGIEHRVWSSGEPREFAQLLLNPSSQSFDRRHDDASFTIRHLVQAFIEARTADVEPASYFADEVVRLFGQNPDE